MASQYVVNLLAQMTALQAQQATLLAQLVTLNYSLDGEAVQVRDAMRQNFADQKLLAEEIRKNQPFEIRTRPLM